MIKNFNGNFAPIIDLDFILVVGYLILTLIVGLVTGRNVKSFKEYAIGTRNLPAIVIGMTISATLIGGGSSLGTATEVFKFGIIVMVAKYGVDLGALLIAFFIVPRMEKFFGMLSVGEIMGSMYGNAARIITGIAGIILCTGRVAAQVMALGFIVKYLFGFPEIIGIVSGTLILIIYSSFGGIRSVVFTDVLQFIALAVTIPIVLNTGLKWVNGYSGLFKMLPSSHISLYPDTKTFIKYLLVLIYMSIPMLTPPFAQRILMSRDTDQAKKSYIFMACTDLFFTTIAGFIGLIAYVYNPQLEANGAFLHLVNNLGVGLKGLAVIGIFSVIMSTADSYLNCISISFVHDVLSPLNLQLSARSELITAKIFTLVAGFFVILIALYFDNIFELAIYVSNFWGPIVVGPLLLGIFGVQINKQVCLFAMFMGMLMFGIWEIYSLKEITNIYSIVPAIFANVITVLILKYSQKYNLLLGFRK